MRQLFRRLFFCRCTRLGMPITVPNGRKIGQWKAGQTYIVCLDCGTEYPYDWKKMRRLEQPKARNAGQQELHPVIARDPEIG